MTVLAPDSLWWDGRFHPGRHLSVTTAGSAPLDGGAADGSVGAAASAPAHGDVGVRRVAGTLLPGLTDAHVHLALSDGDTIRAGGIGEVWDLGGFARPGLRYAGQFLTAPGGYPSDRSWAPPGSSRFVHSPADGVEAVAEQEGASFIKVTLHAGGPLLPPATVAAIAAAARAQGLPLIVHCEGPGTVETALEAGADLLAHTPWTTPLDDGVLRAAAARTTWISTLDIHGWGTPTPDGETAIGNLRLFLSYGGKVLYGTDLGNGPLVEGVNPREIRALQRAGLSPADILTAMTPSAAGLPPTWIPGGLDLDPAHLADSLATARVLEG